MKEAKEQAREETARLLAQERRERKASAEQKLAAQAEAQASELAAERQRTEDARLTASRAVASTSVAVAKGKRAAVREATTSVAPQLEAAKKLANDAERRAE